MATHLRKLGLRNYRRFEDLEITLHPALTVLVAGNGGGKTAILDAVAISIRYFVETLRGVTSTHGFERSDVRLARRGGRWSPSCRRSSTLEA